MTETQLNLFREWFREEVEYLIKKNVFPEKHRTDDQPSLWVDKAFDDVVVAFCKEDN
jgi:hypothetical protein